MRTCVRLLDGQAILTLRLGQQARGTWQAANADTAHVCLMTFRETSVVCLRFVLPELSSVPVFAPRAVNAICWLCRSVRSSATTRAGGRSLMQSPLCELPLVQMRAIEQAVRADRGGNCEELVTTGSQSAMMLLRLPENAFLRALHP